MNKYTIKKKFRRGLKIVIANPTGIWKDYKGHIKVIEYVKEFVNEREEILIYATDGSIWFAKEVELVSE